MSKLTVYDKTGASVGDVEVADVFLQTSKGEQAVHDVVVAQMSRRRSGSASTLTKGEVAGSGKKPWRQKGTGRARAGYRQSPVWRGGATAFGPRPRDYGKKVNRKVARLALQRAFAEKVTAGAVKVVDRLTVDEPRTKACAALLKALDVTGPVLIVTDEIDRNLALSARNLPRVELVTGRTVSVYELLRFPTVVLTRAGMDQITGRLGAKTEGAA